MAIGACDLAEVLGSAVALNLLFHIRMLPAVCITAFDVFLLLALQGLGMRMIEAVVGVLVGTIAVSYCIEIFVLPQVRPNVTQMAHGMIPTLHLAGMTSLAIAMIGATVMPHNLYLHSALVQSRRFQTDDVSIRKAIKFNTIDSTVALIIAFFINAAILVLAAMVFYGKEHVAVAGGKIVTFNADSDWIRIAYLTLAPLLGTAAASTLFAVALLASGEAAHHPRAGHPSGGAHYRHPRRRERHKSDQSQPGGAGDPASICHVSAAALHQLAQAHGAVADRLVAADNGLG